MKNPPQELTKKWFKANVPDSKDTKKLKEMVEQSEKYLLSFSLPGDIKLNEIRDFIGLLGKITAEAKALLQKPDLGDKVLVKLRGYENACKIAKNYFLTLLEERDAGQGKASQADAEILATDMLIKRAEKELPALASKLTLLVEGIRKATTDAERDQLKKDAKTVMDAAKTTVLGVKAGTWEQQWQNLRRKAAPENFALDQPTANKYRAKLDEIGQGIAKIIKIRDALLQRYNEAMA